MKNKKQVLPGFRESNCLYCEIFMSPWPAAGKTRSQQQHFNMTLQTTKERLRSRKCLQQHFLDHFITSYQSQVTANRPWLSCTCIIKHTNKRREGCTETEGDVYPSCNLLNPPPLYNGHGSTPALVAMGFHFPPRIMTWESLHAE